MNEVAKAIYEQLGGNRFTMMTGSKAIAQSDNSLTFQLSRNESKANRMTVTLTSMDLYDITFNAQRGGETKEMKSYQGVYFDQLQELFTSTTGLYTRF